MSHKFDFRFNSILEIKEKIEEDKKNKFGIAVQKLEKEKKILDELIEKKASIRNYWNNKAKGLVQIKELKNLSIQLELIDNLIEQQKLMIKQCQKETDNRRNELIDAKKQTKTFEKLKEKDYELYKYNQMKIEEALVDQIVSYNSANLQRQ